MTSRLTGILPLATLSLCLATGASSHTVLFEKFTNVGCAPCAIFAPQADSLLDMRLGEVVEITYHGNVPYPNDEYFLPVRDQVNERIWYYEPAGYPALMLDGRDTPTRIADIDAYLDFLKLTVEPSIDLSVKADMEGDVLHVSVSAEALRSDLGRDLRLFVAAVEEEVRPERPAFNGQTVFHNEFRQFLSLPYGTPVGELASAGGSVTKEFDWTIERFEDRDELAVVAWVQDRESGKVFETAFVPRKARHQEAARVVRVTDTPTEICAPRFSGKLWLRNMGANELTSCDITVDIDGDIHSFPWRGSLPYLATEEVEIPPFTDFELDPEGAGSEVTIGAANLNGTDAVAESCPVELPYVLTAHKGVKLLLSTDNKPHEISWRLLDANGSLMAESEPYTEMRHKYETILPINADGCYSIEFLDSGHDGITGNYGAGFYRLYETDGTTEKEIIQAAYRGGEHTQAFRAADVVPAAVASPVESRDILFDAASRTLTFPQGGEARIHTLDGRLAAAASPAAGESIGLSHLEKGIYVVSIKAAEASASITIHLD